MLLSNFCDGDPNSFSNPEQCVVTDIYLKLEVDFRKRILFGFVDLTLDRKDLKADIVLDTRDLLIHNVKNKNNSSKLNFQLGKPDENFGSPLEIKLPKRGNKKFVVRIEYETSPKCSALQWLEPEQTAGKKHPYVFSSCQAIYARSLLPCQDTPGVKATYTASISVPFELVVLMGAVRDGEEMDEDPLMKKYKFVQKVPVPSYLFSIVVGPLESRKIGPRSCVWSEKEFLDKAADEFSETEQMLQTAEEIAGEYLWGAYDLLVMPPSFPFGGMENPCLTFVTPTLLAGDKSLVYVIAHEIAHSWTGNLVTNKNFEHFWLNEGFTEFLTRKIIGRIHGKPTAHLLALHGWNNLQFYVEFHGETSPFTRLVTDLKGIDPAEALCVVPYEKGHTFLYYLEELLGGPEVFEKFLRDYIAEYKYKSLDTDEWKSYLYKYFPEKEEILNSVDWNTWLYAPGMPPVKPGFDESLLTECKALANSWLKSDDSELVQFTSEDISGFSSNQITEFLALLLQEKPISIAKLERMDEVYKMHERTNSEIRFRWIRLGLLAHWKEIIPDGVKFITEQSRLLYIQPIYNDMYKWDETRDLALSTYKEHSSKMIYAASACISRVLHLSNKVQE